MDGRDIYLGLSFSPKIDRMDNLLLQIELILVMTSASLTRAQQSNERNKN